MIMMMTVMMVVLMTMNDRLSIVMAHIIESAAVSLTAMIFTVFVVALWSW